jgi:hypothetical protein
MDIRLAEFVRWVDPIEPLDDLINDARAATWTQRREHALFETEDGRLMLLAGGADGILISTALGIGLHLVLQDATHRLCRLVWHTHPEPTGPSDYDRNILKLLGQESSMLYEICGAKGGTIYTARERRRTTE